MLYFHTEIKNQSNVPFDVDYITWKIVDKKVAKRTAVQEQIIPVSYTHLLKVDSVVCDFNAYPYRAVTYATQKIIRQSNVTERSLVTTCRLLNASRSDDNPNGFTIEGFTIIENKDLQTIKR